MVNAIGPRSWAVGVPRGGGSGEAGGFRGNSQGSVEGENLHRPVLPKRRGTWVWAIFARPETLGFTYLWLAGNEEKSNYNGLL